MKIKILLTMFLIGLFFFTFFKLVQVKGSRSSTYPDNSYCVVNKLVYKLVSPKRKDLVVYRDKSLDIENIDRIIGLPEDTIELRNGKVFLNGVILYEPYLPSLAANKTDWGIFEGKIYLPVNNQYFLLSDARLGVLHGGKDDFIDRSAIVGKVEFCK